MRWFSLVDPRGEIVKLNFGNQKVLWGWEHYKRQWIPFKRNSHLSSPLSGWCLSPTLWSRTGRSIGSIYSNNNVLFYFGKSVQIPGLLALQSRAAGSWIKHLNPVGPGYSSLVLQPWEEQLEHSQPEVVCKCESRNWPMASGNVCSLHQLSIPFLSS